MKWKGDETIPEYAVVSDVAYKQLMSYKLIDSDAADPAVDEASHLVWHLPVANVEHASLTQIGRYRYLRDGPLVNHEPRPPPIRHTHQHAQCKNIKTNKLKNKLIWKNTSLNCLI